MEKPNIRLLETDKLRLDEEKRDIKKVAGGILVQTANTYTVSEKDLKTVTKKKPSALEIRAMLFANKVCKHVMSNSVVFAKSENGRDITAGIGAGQMSRVDSVWIAARKGADRVKGSVMASDAFFPFPDAVEEAAKAGATAIISPGGSVRDEEVIAAADRLGIAMVFTGIRLFRH
jgi:phosphoribosylaminoimidazolecarboxamide formyltransferase/IMP cyclohydrolase